MLHSLYHECTFPNLLIPAMWVDMDAIVCIEIQEWILQKNYFNHCYIALDDPENFKLPQGHECKSIIS